MTDSPHDDHGKMRNCVQQRWMTVLLLAATLAASPLAGCSTAPKAKNQASFIAKANAARGWFDSNVPGLRNQIDRSAGYIIFPDITQWGFLISGGHFGRGVLNRPDDTPYGSKTRPNRKPLTCQALAEQWTRCG